MAADRQPSASAAAEPADDLAARRRAEAALRESEERLRFFVDHHQRAERNFAFLADASQDLAGLGPMDGILEQLGAKMGAFFGASRIVFTEIGESGNAACSHSWSREGAAELPAAFRLGEPGSEQYLRAARAGEAYFWREGDGGPPAPAGRAEPAAAAIGVPLLRDGRWLFQLALAADEKREWRGDEIELLRELAARTFARVERARAEEALRVSEARLAAMIAALPVGIGFVDQSGEVVFANRGMRSYLPSGMIPSREAGRPPRWRAWLPDGSQADPQDFPGARATLRASIQMVETLADTRHSRIRYRPPAAPVLLRADAERLVQVFANLLANALKFSPTGSAVDLWVEPGAMAVVKVRDYGRGIAAENLAEIFEPFVQSKLSLGIPDAGLGLGLSVSRELTELHGGSIAASSGGLGQGSTFSVSLPLASPD